MKRRDILKMAPAALAASAVPVAALSVADPGETPVMRLYREFGCRACSSPVLSDNLDMCPAIRW